MATMCKTIITLGIIILASGEPFPCNDHTSLGDNGITCDCQDRSFYNANLGICQGVCDFFGDNVCTFYFDNTICVQNPLNATDYECKCAPGYEKDTETEMCLDTDECSTTLSCPEYDNKMCYDLEGGDVCDCMPNYFLNQDNECQEINLCNVPETLTSCEQLCTFEGNNSFTCSCYEGFVVDHHNDSLCSIDVGNLYSDCFCTYPNITACAREVNHTKHCYPLPGYQFASDNVTIEDIDECKDETYQCPLASKCVNDIGSYHCDCLPGYYQIDEDDVLIGCEPESCGDGLILYNGKCIDPCEGLDVTCPLMSVCLADEKNVPLCSCQVECQNSGLPNSSTFSIYLLSIYLPYEDATVFEYSQKKYLLTKSMEFIFGKGNAEVVEGSIIDGHTGLGITLEIGVSMPLEDKNIIRDVILKHCWELELVDSQPQCVLPGGLILNRYSIDVEEIDRCEDSALCEDISNSICVESEVSSGRYWCACLEGFEPIGDRYCEDINECITGNDYCEEGMVCVNGFGNYSCEIDSAGLSTFEYIVDEANEQVIEENSGVNDIYEDLNDQEQKTKTIGGYVGGVFGVIFIILVIALVYISRKRTKKENSPSGEEGKTTHSDSPSLETSEPTQEASDTSDPPEPHHKLSEPSPGPSDASIDPSNIVIESSVYSSELSDSSPKLSEPFTEPSDTATELSVPSPGPSEPSLEPTNISIESELSDSSPKLSKPFTEPSDTAPELSVPSPGPSDPSLEPTNISIESELSDSSAKLPEHFTEPSDKAPELSDLSPGPLDSSIEPSNIEIESPVYSSEVLDSSPKLPEPFTEPSNAAPELSDPSPGSSEASSEPSDNYPVQSDPSPGLSV